MDDIITDKVLVRYDANQVVKVNGESYLMVDKDLLIDSLNDFITKTRAPMRDRTELREAILFVLRSNGSMGSKEILGKLHEIIHTPIGPKTLRNSIDALVNKGALIRQGTPTERTYLANPEYKENS